MAALLNAVGLNGHSNGVNGSTNGNGASSNGRILHLIHTESNTRLSITGIPTDIFGLAADFRQEFYESIKEDGRYAALIPEGQSGEDEQEQEDQENASKAQATNNSGLLLAAYWLQFLSTQHSVASPILSASRSYFERVFLKDGTHDIHQITSKLDVQDKKAVIRAWIAISAKLEQDSETSVGFGPRGKIWRDDVETRVYAVFGGQGSNEYYWDEMEYLYDVYAPLFSSLLQSTSSLLQSLSTRHSTTLHYPHSLQPLRWLTDRSTRPPVPYLASCAVSLPLIGLVQQCQYMVTGRLLGFTPTEMAKRMKGATGHSQGVVTAAVISMGGDSWDDYINNANEGLKILFYIGLRGTEAFPPLSLSPSVVSSSIESGEGTPYPMLAVTGLLQSQLDPVITQTNTFLDDSESSKGRHVKISLFNGLKAFIVTGPPASLVGLVNNLKKNRAESGKDQSKTPHSKRLPVFSMRFLPIGVPYHSPYLSECTSTVRSTDLLDDTSSFWTRSKLLIPVYNTETGRDIRTDVPSPASGDSSLLAELLDQVFSREIHWQEATKFDDAATHVVDFGTGGLSGIGSLTARETEGKGLRVVIASTGTNGRGVEETYSATSVKLESQWLAKFGPKLVKTRHDGKIHLDTPMSRLLSKPPLMVPGMTPSTVGAGFNAAVANAGYHIELAGGGHYNAKALRSKVNDIISRFETPGIGLTLNALYINQRQFTFQLPEWIKMKAEGLPIEGLCVAAGIPSTENATQILSDLRAGGIKHVSFKPGSVEGIRQVINIASANPDYPIIMQWTGGRAGGHHSCEDFHQPMLATYASIRQHPNIILVAGSGFGDAEGIWPYLSGSWSQEYGVQKMPYDGFLFGSWTMVAKEAHTSQSVKDLIVKCAGVQDSKWEGTYDKETGGIITVRSELGEPIHKVATRGVKLWKEFDNTVFALPREKRGAWLADKKDYVIKKLNADFQKPWFAAKADGKVCDLGDMTYAEVATRMVRLMYVSHEKRWIDPSLRKLTGDWLRRTEDRLSSVNDSSPKASALQSYESLADPSPFLEQFFAQYPAARKQILASEDIAYFLAICQRAGQKPTPFIAVLDNNFEVWFKKDSLWFAEDIEAVFDQDPQRVCILQGPVAAYHAKRSDQPIKEMFGEIKDQLIQNVLQEVYGGDESKIPVIEYLAPEPKGTLPTTTSHDDTLSAHKISHTSRASSTSENSTIHIYTINESLPNQDEWLSLLAGPQLGWLRAFLTSVNVSQGTTALVANGAKKLFVPRKGQRIEVEVDDRAGRAKSVKIFGAIRN